MSNLTIKWITGYDGLRVRANKSSRSIETDVMSYLVGGRSVLHITRLSKGRSTCPRITQTSESTENMYIINKMWISNAVVVLANFEINSALISTSSLFEVKDSIIYFAITVLKRNVVS